MRNIYRDRQQDPPVCFCTRCGGEIYAPEEGEVCIACQKELQRWDQKTANAILEDMDFELRRYLSDDLRNTVWNSVAPKYLEEE